jgi:hypothetical protein
MAYPLMTRPKCSRRAAQGGHRRHVDRAGRVGDLVGYAALAASVQEALMAPAF